MSNKHIEISLKKLSLYTFILFILAGGNNFLAIQNQNNHEMQMEANLKVSEIPDPMRPQLRILGKNDYLMGGVISQTAQDAPEVVIEGYNIAGTVNLDIYEATKEDIISYLIYDDKSQQINPAVNLAGRQKIGATTAYLNEDYWNREPVALPLSGSGIWVIHIYNSSAESFAFVIRSNIGALVKQGNNEFVIWTQDLVSKRSVDGGIVQMYSLKNTHSVIHEYGLNGQGIATAPLTDNIDIAFVTRGDDIALVPINLEYLNYQYSYWYNQSFGPSARSARFFLFTDRPLYKPGDTLYFKSIIRSDDDARYSIPNGIAYVSIYEGYENEPILTKNYTITSDGTVYGELTLPENAKAGFYTIKVDLDPTADAYDYNLKTTSYFQVEYYRKPEYFVDLSSQKSEYVAGDTAIATAHGAYFFGQPLSGKTVSYNVYTSDFYEYSYFNTWNTTLSDDYRYWYYWGESVKSGTVTLNDDGNADIALDTSFIRNSGKSQVLTVEIEFVDESGNPSFSRKNILVYAGEYGIYRNDQAYSSRVGEVLDMSFKTQPREGIHVQTATLTAQITRSAWIRYKSEIQGKDKTTSYSGYAYREEVEQLPPLRATTNESGIASFKLTPTKPGSYQVAVSGKDKRGNTVSQTFWYWVQSTDEPLYLYERSYDSGITISADKEMYSDTDHAYLTIYSDIPDRDIFLSFDRAYVNRYQIVHLTGNSETIESALTKSDIPNISVKVASFSNDAFQTDRLNLKVSTDPKKLITQITPDKTTYAPGDTVVLTIYTTGIGGNPVSADTAVWAVDKALFELVSENPLSIDEAFWYERYDGTQEAHSLQGIHVSPAAEMGGGGGGNGGNRSIFKDTAYWNPSVHTNTNGQATVSFKLPDNLTTWVISAVGATTDTKVGKDRTEIVVTKGVIVRPILPNIIRVGDTITVSAIVNNFTGSQHIFNVSLDVEGQDISMQNQRVTIASDKSKHVFWTLSPGTEVKTAKLTFSAVAEDTDDASDTVIQEVPIIQYGFHDTTATQKTGTATYNIQLNSFADWDKTTLTLSLSPSLLGTLPTAMKYLVDYPYGCVEQTTSKFVPAVIALTNPDIFGDTLSDQDVGKMIQTGLDRLKLLQQPSGGWGWWTGGESNPFVTAYVIEYLHEAEKAGFSIDQDMKNAYMNFLTQGIGTAIAEERVSRLYALSLLGDPNGNEAITNFNLEPDLLALAVLHNIRIGITSPTQNGLSVLINKRVDYGDDQMYWPAADYTRFGSIDASTALVMRALVAAHADEKMIGNTARYLLKTRKNTYWSNTYATAQVIRAVVDQTRIYNEENSSYSYTVFLDDKQIRSGSVTSFRDLIDDITLSGNDIRPTGSTITIKKSDGAGQLYSTLAMDQFITDKNQKARGNGISIERSYRNINGSQTFGIGDTVEVALTVSGLGGNYNYGLIEDQLPAGMIPINTNLANEQSGQDSYYPYWGQSREIKQNGIIIGLYSMYSTSETHTYQARVVANGTFYVPPASVHLMYTPEISALSDAHTVTIAGDNSVVNPPSFHMPPPSPNYIFNPTGNPVMIQLPSPWPTGIASLKATKAAYLALIGILALVTAGTISTIVIVRRKRHKQQKPIPPKKFDP